MQQLIETGTIEQPYIGISLVPINPTPAMRYGLAVVNGIYAMDIAVSSPAQTAALQVDDIITAIDGQDIGAERSLADILFSYQPADTVTLKVLRNGEEVNIDPTLTQPHEGPPLGAPCKESRKAANACEPRGENGCGLSLGRTSLC